MFGTDSEAYAKRSTDRIYNLTFSLPIVKLGGNDIVRGYFSCLVIQRMVRSRGRLQYERIETCVVY